MNEAHYHLLFNHLPILFPVTGILILAGGFFFHSPIVQRAGCLIFVVGALTAFAAQYTGEGAEHVLKQLHLADRKAIHAHESLADTFAILSYVLGAVALLAAWASWKRQPFSRLLMVITLLYSGVVFYFGARTGTTGGEVRHTEIRSGVTPVDSSLQTPAETERD